MFCMCESNRTASPTVTMVLAQVDTAAPLHAYTKVPYLRLGGVPKTKDALRAHVATAGVLDASGHRLRRRTGEATLKDLEDDLRPKCKSWRRSFWLWADYGQFKQSTPLRLVNLRQAAPAAAVNELNAQEAADAEENADEDADDAADAEEADVDAEEADDAEEDAEEADDEDEEDEDEDEEDEEDDSVWDMRMKRPRGRLTHHNSRRKPDVPQHVTGLWQWIRRVRARIR